MLFIVLLKPHFVTNEIIISYEPLGTNNIIYYEKFLQLSFPFPRFGCTVAALDAGYLVNRYTQNNIGHGSTTCIGFKKKIINDNYYKDSDICYGVRPSRVSICFYWFLSKINHL